MSESREMLGVNVISESNFTVRGHGVHSAFQDQISALKALGSVEVLCNSLTRSAEVAHAHTLGPIALRLLARGQLRVLTAHLVTESLVGSIRGVTSFRSVVSSYLRVNYNRANLVIAFNKFHADELRGLGVRSKIEIVPNAWPADISKIPSRGTARELLGLPHDRQIVLSVGQIQPRKAPSVFYECAGRAPDKLFIWVGGHPFGMLTAERASMRALIQTAPSNVIHTGAIARRWLYNYYAAADVYFHPSYHELCPIAVLEAAAAGLPLVLRNLPIYRDLMCDWPVRGDEETFPAQIDWILSDVQASVDLSRCARRTVQGYSPEATARALLHLYSNAPKTSR